MLISTSVKLLAILLTRRLIGIATWLIDINKGGIQMISASMLKFIIGGVLVLLVFLFVRELRKHRAVGEAEAKLEVLNQEEEVVGIEKKIVKKRKKLDETRRSLNDA